MRREKFFNPSKGTPSIDINEECTEEQQQQEEQQSPQPSSSTQKTLDSNIVNKDVTTSEIIWTLKSVVSGFSNNSCDDFAPTLRAMCPDSKLAKEFKLGRTKLMYLVNYGIAPHFKSLLDVVIR